MQRSAWLWIVLAACCGLCSCAIVHPRPPFQPNVRQVRTEHFDLTTDLVRPTPEEAAAEAERVFARVMSVLPETSERLRAKRIPLEVFQREEDFVAYRRGHDLDGGQGFTCWFGETALFHPVSSEGVLKPGVLQTADDYQVEEEDRSEFARRLAHELTHRALRAGRLGSLPLWAEEGICDWTASRAVGHEPILRFSSEVSLFLELLHGATLYDPALRQGGLVFESLPEWKGHGPHATGRVVIFALARDPETEKRLTAALGDALQGKGFRLALPDRLSTLGAFEDFVVSRWEACFLATFREALRTTPELLEAHEYAAIARALFPGCRRSDLRPPYVRLRAQIEKLEAAADAGALLPVAR